MMKTSEEARRDFRHVLNDADHGKPTVITRHGEPVAVVVPLHWYEIAAGVLELDRASEEGASGE